MVWSMTYSSVYLSITGIWDHLWTIQSVEIHKETENGWSLKRDHCCGPLSL